MLRAAITLSEEELECLRDYLIEKGNKRKGDVKDITYVVKIEEGDIGYHLVSLNGDRVIIDISGHGLDQKHKLDLIDKVTGFYKGLVKKEEGVH